MITTRGAVMVESAFAVTLLLLLIYGGVQLGLIGLQQLTVDGGAYAVAHQQALRTDNPLGTTYLDAPTLAKETLPHLNSSAIAIATPTNVAAPTTGGTTNLGNYYGLTNSSARHGGVSMIQPVQTVSSVTSKNFASVLLGVANSITVTGIAIDPAFQLINGHSDVAGNGFNNAAAFSTASDPLVNGNNAPPYFVGFNYVHECLYTIPANAVWGWSPCPQFTWAGLSLAEYLDVNNWGRPVNGVAGLTAVFYEARLHQAKFALIADTLETTSQAGKAALLDPLGGGVGDVDINGNQVATNVTNVAVECVYSFDNTKLGTYNLGATKIGDYPLTPAGDPVICGQ